MKKIITASIGFLLFIANVHTQHPDLKQISDFQSTDDAKWYRYQTVPKTGLLSYVDEGNFVNVFKLTVNNASIFYKSQTSVCNDVSGVESYLLMDSLLVFIFDGDIVIENMYTSEITRHDNVLDVQYRYYFHPQTNNRTIVISSTETEPFRYLLIDRFTNQRKEIYEGSIVLLNDKYCYIYKPGRVEKIDLISFASTLIINGIKNAQFYLNGLGNVGAFQINKIGSEFTKLILLNNEDNILEVDSINGYLSNCEKYGDMYLIQYYNFSDGNADCIEKLFFYNGVSKKKVGKEKCVYDTYNFIGRKENTFYIDNSRNLFEYYADIDSLYNTNISLGYIYSPLKGDTSVIVSGIDDVSYSAYFNLITKDYKPLSNHRFYENYPEIISYADTTMIFFNRGIERKLITMESDSIKYLYGLPDIGNIGLASSEVYASDQYIFTINSHRIFIFDSLSSNGVIPIDLPDKIFDGILSTNYFKVIGDVLYYLSPKKSSDGIYRKLTVMQFDFNTKEFKDLLSHLDYEILPDEAYNVRLHDKVISIDSFIYFYDLGNKNDLTNKTSEYVQFEFEKDGKIYIGIYSSYSGNLKCDLYELDTLSSYQWRLIAKDVVTSNVSTDIEEKRTMIRWNDKVYLIYNGILKEVKGIGIIDDFEIMKFTNRYWFLMESSGVFYVYDIIEFPEHIDVTLKFEGNLFTNIGFGEAYLRGDNLFFESNARRTLGSINLITQKTIVKQYTNQLLLISIHENEFIAYDHVKNTFDAYDFDFNLIKSRPSGVDLQKFEWSRLSLGYYNDIKLMSPYKVLVYDKLSSEIPFVFNTDSLSLSLLKNCQNRFSNNYGNYYLYKNNKLYFNFHDGEDGSQLYSFDSPILSEINEFVIDQNIEEIGLYPNPGNGLFNIKTKHVIKEGNRVKVFAADGKMYETIVHNHGIDVSFLNNGYYSFLIADKNVLRGKFIIMK